MKAIAQKTIEAPQPNEKKQFPRVTTNASLILARASDNPDELVNWPLPIRYSFDKLTPKQRHFAICRANGMRQAEAYRRAYNVADDASDNSVAGCGSDTAAIPHVAESIRLLLDWVSREWLLDAHSVIEYGYTKLYEEAENAKNASDRLRATEILMKAHGAFISRSEVKHVHEVAAPVQELMTAFMDLI